MSPENFLITAVRPDVKLSDYPLRPDSCPPESDMSQAFYLIPALSVSGYIKR